MQFKISPCQPEPFKDCAPLKMCQSLWRIFFLGSFQDGKIHFMLLCTVLRKNSMMSFLQL